MSERLAKSAGTVGIAVMTSRILGVIRDQVMAGLFGTGVAHDAFNIAMRVPSLVRDLFAEGAMSAAFVPTFTRYWKAEGKDAAFRLGNLVLNGLLVVTSALVILGMLFAAPLLSLLPKEFSGPDGRDKFTLTVELTRIVLPFLTLVAVAVAMGGMLNSLRRFFVPALSPAIYNVGMLLSALGLIPVFGHFGLEPIYAIAVGTLVGGLGQILVQLPVLHREGFRYRPIVSFTDPGMREILFLMGPATLGLAASQINIIVNTVLAVGEGDGAITALALAFRLMYLPIGLFGVSVATAALPEIARQVNAGALADVRRTISSSLRMMLMMSVPATVGLMVLAGPIIELIFQRGAFDASSTQMTAMALLGYAPGLLGYSAVKIASPTFYAMKDARTPVLISMATIVLNLVLNLVLVRYFSFQGLAMGTAIAALFNAACLFLVLSRRIDGIDGSRVALATGKILIASLAMGAAAYGTEQWLNEVLPQFTSLAGWMAVTTRAGIRVFGAIAVGVLVLCLAAWALRLQEFMDVARKILSKVKR
jgi:putative peptidoglycan lipid II flippase